MKVYLDTSVILRKILGERGALKDWGRWRGCYTSEITSVEAMRALDRLRLEGWLLDVEMAEKMRLLRKVFSATGVIVLNRAVLEKASQSFPTVVATLDAIHLASAMAYGEERDEELIFLTHDRQLGLAAQAMGLDVRGVSGQ